MRSDSSLDKNVLRHYLIFRDAKNPPVVKKSRESRQKEVDNKVASKVHRRQEATQKTQQLKQI